MTKTELLALADEKPTSINDDLYAWATQAAAALREYAGMLDAQPEFCCESAWRDAKALAWKQRDLNCGCDHNEYCGKCFPLDFRKGGKWDKYTHPPAPTMQEPIAWLYTCQKPGTQTVYASVDENDSYHWPIDQWKLIVKTPLFAHPPAPITQEPVAWLSAYVNSVGLPDHYVTTHHELAVENDANRSPKPLFFNPPTTHEPVAWIDSMGHPHHLSAIQGVREKQLYGPWRPLYD